MGGSVAGSCFVAGRLTVGLGTSEEGWLLAASTSRVPMSDNNEKLAFS